MSFRPFTKTFEVTKLHRTLVKVTSGRGDRSTAKTSARNNMANIWGAEEFLFLPFRPRVQQKYLHCASEPVDGRLGSYENNYYTVVLVPAGPCDSCGSSYKVVDKSKSYFTRGNPK